jgi:hypothetical protein
MDPDGPYHCFHASQRRPEDPAFVFDAGERGNPGEGEQPADTVGLVDKECEHDCDDEEHGAQRKCWPSRGRRASTASHNGQRWHILRCLWRRSGKTERSHHKT